MASLLVVFLRGINDGATDGLTRVFRKSLGGYDIVSVRAAGTFVVRKPGAGTKFRAELARAAFATEVVFCDGRDLIRLETESPLKKTNPSLSDI